MHSFIIVHFFFFFNDTATTEIYTLSLHDALPICRPRRSVCACCRSSTDERRLLPSRCAAVVFRPYWSDKDRKSTRLNSSHLVISYAVFCLKKKKTNMYELHRACQRVHISSISHTS